MRRSVILILALFFCDSCIDRIDIEIPNESFPLVVEGLITNEVGPYTVQLTKASKLNEDLNFRKFLSAKSVAIYDDANNAELLEEVETGVYQTKENGIRGQIGRSYFIRIEMFDGKVYESIPDKLNPVGEIDRVYYEHETRQPFDAPTQYGLSVYADGKGLPGGENYFRWKFEGTYIFKTYPELATIFQETNPCIPNPLPCRNDGPDGSCTCCTCWQTEFDIEGKPIVSDNRILVDGIFKRIELGYVPLDYLKFQIKYRIKVKQMSLSRAAFDYWRIIQSQKEGAGSLFQPPAGKPKTNIFEKNGSAEALGIFYASGVKSNFIYVTNAAITEQWRKLEIPRYGCEKGRIADDCRFFGTNIKPIDWE
jgi:Domain of unknown function (DUF4249)